MMKQQANVDFSHLGIDVYADVLTIPTYRLGPPDPNPPLFAKGVRDVYPYCRRDAFTGEIEDRVYDAVKLVSPWIEATILPDWGFHLYRAVDRLTGRDMFHCPAVMKPANNAIRGAYVAGGVEMNFPVGHSAMTYDRTGLYLKKTAEGVSALFHHIDRCSGMALTAGITLTRAFRGVMFDQFLHNRTALPRPWYYWLNAGIAPDKSLRFMFPNERMLGHFEGPYLETKQEYAYPIHAGRDYSQNMDIPEPIGLFSFGNTQGWFGAWYDDWDFGIVRWAAPWRAGGQKFWSWGNSDEGMLWGAIAADQSLPVPEIQSGRPEVQMDRGVMPPYAATSHREWWMPVSAINDVATASRFGAMNIVARNDACCLRISAARDMADCTVVVNESEVGGGLDLKVGAISEIPLAVPMAEVAGVTVRHADGVLWSWDSGRSREAANVLTLLDAPRPMAEMSAEALCLRGLQFERTLRPDLALECYRKCLDVDPEHSGARLHIGLIHLMNDERDDALREFKAALQTDRTSEQALYLHGLASWWNGDEKQAKADFAHTAATGREYAAPAIVRLAIAACRHDDAMALELLLEDGLTAAPGNPALLMLKTINGRRKHPGDPFQATVALIEKQLGICAWLENEKALGGAEQTLYLPAADETEDSLRIAMANAYSELGCTDQAVVLLERCQSATGRAEAGYLSRRLGTNAGEFRKTPFFAHGRVAKDALGAAIESDKGDAAARFSLGLLLTNEGNWGAAVSLFRAAVDIEDDNALYLTTLGRVLSRLGHHEEGAGCQERAIRAFAGNPLAWVELDHGLGPLGRRNQSWLDRFNGAPESVKRNDDARMALAKLNGDLGFHAEAERLLSDHVFHPYELSHDLRNLWSAMHRANAVGLALAGKGEEARTAIGKALEYPAGLQLGKPLRGFDAPTLFVAALICEHGGDTSGARVFLRRAADEFQPDPAPCRAWSILAMIRLGETERAHAEIEKLSRAAERYLAAGFQPDLNGQLRQAIGLCEKIRSGWMPGLRDCGGGAVG